MSTAVVNVGPGCRNRVTVAPCSRLGGPTGETVDCPSCNGSVRLKTFSCEAHGACTLEKPVNGVACCTGCLDRDPPLPRAHPLALQVRCKSTGIGDNLLALTTAAGLQRDYGLPVAFCCNPRESAWAKLFWPWVVTSPLPLPGVADDEDQKAAFDAKRTSRWRFWADAAGVQPVLPEPMPLPRAATEWAIRHTHRLVLSPFSAWESRCWPLWHWLELERICYANGIATVVLDDRPERTAAFRGERLIGESPARVAAVIAGAICFVGNDSGMAHVAGMLGAPSLGIVHPVSDRGILDLYPTVKSVQAVGLTPQALFEEIAATIRAGLEPGFPADEFAATVTEHDRWRLPAWLTIYSVLWRTVRELNPRRIVEIGVRAGQSAWTMLNACPDASVIGIDAEGADDAQASATGGFVGAGQHARELLTGKQFLYLAKDSRTLDTVPACEFDADPAYDLGYVDGDHSEEGCYSDLCLMGRSDVKTILVDDYANRESVRAACKRWMAENPDRRGRFIPSETGLYLIERSG